MMVDNECLDHVLCDRKSSCLDAPNKYCQQAIKAKDDCYFTPRST